MLDRLVLKKSNNFTQDLNFDISYQGKGNPFKSSLKDSYLGIQLPVKTKLSCNEVKLTPLHLSKDPALT
jgi:hypothetical protein